VQAELPARNVERRAGHERIPLLHFVILARPLVALTAPLIYAMVVPFLLLDLGVTLYQRLCFPIYGIAKVRRSEYLIFDRARWPYLNVLERLSCAYCSYANVRLLPQLLKGEDPEFSYIQNLQAQESDAQDPAIADATRSVTLSAWCRRKWTSEPRQSTR